MQQSFEDILREKMAQPVSVKGKDAQIMPMEAMVLSVMNDAMKGSIQAITFIRQITEGKTTDTDADREEREKALADELDMEPTFMRQGFGSTGQMTETIDPRLTLLEKFDRTLTADLEALGLNYNANPKRIIEPTREDETKQGMLTKKLSELMG